MDISGLLGILALVGFLVFLAGAGIAVANASQGRQARGGVLLAIIGLIAGILFWIVSNGLIIVEPTRVAIVINTLTGTVDEPRGPGAHIILPVVQQVAITYSTTQQFVEMSEDASSANAEPIVGQTNDGQTVRLDVTVRYRVQESDARDLFLTWRDASIADGFVIPTARSVVRDVLSGFSAEGLYSGDRARLSADVVAALTSRFADANLLLTDVLVRGISFSDEFTAAIEQKVVAEQNLERARTVAQQAETEAQGRANAAVAAAQGEAQATILQAQAEAEALRLVSEQIAANPSLIQYLYVQNLSDNIQLALVPSNSPFLFDFNSLAQPNSGFVAPEAVPSQPTPTPTPSS
jgi:prohibitin 2